MTVPGPVVDHLFNPIVLPTTGYCPISAQHAVALLLVICSLSAPNKWPFYKVCYIHITTLHQHTMHVREGVCDQMAPAAIRRRFAARGKGAQKIFCVRLCV